MTRGELRRPVRRALVVLAAYVVLEYLVLPQVAGAGQAIHLLSRVSLALLVAGVALEAAAIAAYAELTRSLLPRPDRPSRFTTLRINLSTLAVSHVVPGGGAAGGSLGFRLLTRQGVPGTEAGFALALQAVGSAVVLNLILWLGLLVSIPGRAFSPLYAAAALIGALVLGAFGASVLLLTRGEERASRGMRWVARHLPFLSEDAVHALVHRLAFRLRELAADRRRLVRALSWAGANWVLDAASLWVFLAAFGHRPSVPGLIVSFGLANVLAAIPITPGGLGVVEGVLVPSLVGFGTPRGVAILGVIGYRLVNFWLPIPLGGLSYLSLRVGSGARADELRKVTEESIDQAEAPREWAERHGLQVPRRPQR
ncbi:MAG: putative heme transporter [Actinomycetota bacterium]|jgi:uncharacterized protein (TIRG00374 family)|nr:putative heme transporter [Actinomycetota bacterium]